MILKTIFGNRSCEAILLSLFHYGENHARAISSEAKIGLTAILRQLNHLEDSGILVSKTVGRTRLYQFNPKSPFTNPLRKLIEVVYETIPIDERQKMFHVRRRPRRKGKPVL